MKKFGFSVIKEDLEFLDKLGRENSQILEIGSFVGISADALSKNGATVHCIDTWSGTGGGDPISEFYKEHGPKKVFKAFCSNMGDRLFKTVFPHVGTSELYASVWNGKMDVIFLDGDHSYGSVKKDIEMWMPFVKDGGILCGHDYGVIDMNNPGRGPMFPGVKRAAQEIGCDGVVGTVWYKRCRAQ